MKIIDGLYFTIGMILFNPLTGESKTPDQLNEDDRTTYDACMGAIASLKALNAFKSYFYGLYGQGLDVANYHLNGATEPFDNFYDSALEEYENARCD
jgi:hypothetical protein